MDFVADSGTGGDAPTPITGASTDREDEDAGMGLLADGRRRREPQTITRPVPALIRPAQALTSGTLTRPCPHPGAQLRITDYDGHRITAFVTNSTRGQLADLELRHRRRARAEDRIRCAKDSGLANLPLHDFTQNQI